MLKIQILVASFRGYLLSENTIKPGLIKENEGDKEEMKTRRHGEL